MPDPVAAAEAAVEAVLVAEAKIRAATGKTPTVTELAAEVRKDESAAAMDALLAGVKVVVPTEPGQCGECFGNGTVRRRRTEAGLEWLAGGEKEAVWTAMCPAGCKPLWHPAWQPPAPPPVSPPAAEPKPVEKPAEPVEDGGIEVEPK